MLSGLRPPEALDLTSLDINFLKNWLEAFEDYYDLNIEKPTDSHKIKSFLSVAGLAVRSLVKSFEPQPKTYVEMKEMLLHHVQPFKSISIERHKFLTCVQLQNESINEYVARLKSLASVCSFDDDTIDTIPNQLIRDQLITGISNKKIVETLLQLGDVNLNEVVQKANAMEQTERNLYSLKEELDHSTLHVNKVVCPLNATDSIKSRRFCEHCKRTGHTKDRCFKLATCTKCGCVGHIAKFCKAQTSKEAMSLTSGPHTSDSNHLHRIECTILGERINFLIDCAATVSVLRRDVIDKYGWNCLLNEESSTATVADKRPLKLTHSFQTALSVFDATISGRFYVAPDLAVDAILGTDLLSKLKFSMSLCGHTLFPILQPDPISEFSDLFDKNLKDSVLTGVDLHEIITTPNEKPMRSGVRPMNQPDSQFITEKISELQSAGVIEISHSPWRSCPVVVSKSDGGKRLTINYKPVNSQTTFDAYPVPNMEELILKLNDARVPQFYHQIPLLDSDKPKTAFFADGQLWQYTRLPFGLKNAVAACSRIMNKIFGDIPNCLVYLDDLLIFGQSQEAHDETLRQVLMLVRKHGLGLNKNKCSFGIDSVDFLGFYLQNGTIKPSQFRVKALQDFPLPGDFKSLERFIGFVTYFSKYVDHFSDICKPLLDMKNCLQSNRKQNPIIDYWPPLALESFDTIKAEIVNSILVIPSPSEELVLRTDASDKCIAAVLQTSSGDPVSFFSRVLSPTEQNYDIVEKEALAVYWGITRSRMILLNRKFTVVTDHKPIQFLFNSVKVSPKILRWRLALQEYTFDVTYCTGKQ
ncbi:MAG: RNase H-like domain-containing protein, partial [Cyanobacteria bacterium J06656_5]